MAKLFRLIEPIPVNKSTLADGILADYDGAWLGVIVHTTIENSPKITVCRSVNLYVGVDGHYFDAPENWRSLVTEL